MSNEPTPIYELWHSGSHGDRPVFLAIQERPRLEVEPVDGDLWLVVLEGSPDRRLDGYGEARIGYRLPHERTGCWWKLRNRRRKRR